MLHLGNLRFAPAEQGEGSAVDASASSQEALRLAARFLHVEPQALAEALVERQVWPVYSLTNLLPTTTVLLTTHYLPRRIERQVVIRGKMQATLPIMPYMAGGHPRRGAAHAQ